MYTYSLNKLIMCYEYLRLRFRVDQLPVKSPPTHIYTYSYFLLEITFEKVGHICVKRNKKFTLSRRRKLLFNE